MPNTTTTNTAPAQKAATKRRGRAQQPATASPDPKARPKRSGPQTAATRVSAGPRQGSTLAAVLTVLTAADGPMTPQAIYDEAQRLGLVPGLTGKTPVSTVQAQLAVAAKAGRYVRRPAPGRYELLPA